MANDPTVIPHPDKIDDVLETPQPGTSEAAKSDPKKKDTTYKENTTSPDELISLDELYTVTGQEALETVIDGYQELKDHQRLSRAHGDAVKLNTEKWIEFSDKSNAIRYGDRFLSTLSQASPQMLSDSLRYTRVLLNRSHIRGESAIRLIHRLVNREGAALKAQLAASALPPPETMKLTLYVHQDETVDEAVARLCNAVHCLPLCYQQLVSWVEKVDQTLVAIRNAPDRAALLQALNTFSGYINTPEGVAHLCQVFCGHYQADTTTPRQLHVATEKQMAFKDVILDNNVSIERLVKTTDKVLADWLDPAKLPILERVSRLLSGLAQHLLDAFATPARTSEDTELRFASLQAQRTCSRLSMILHMVQGLLQCVVVGIFTTVRSRLESPKPVVVTEGVVNGN